MDRLDQLLHYYTKCRRGVILHQWKELHEIDDMNVVDVINRFHELLLADLQEQTKWYQSVFNQNPKNSSHVILPIYSQALSALDPSPLHSIESLIKKPTADEGLFMLQQIKLSADRLLQGVEVHFKDSGSVDDEVLRQFSESLYQLFRLVISNKYKGLCHQHLMEQFPQSIDDSSEITESIHNLRQNHSKISSLMKSTLKDCVVLTHGCGLELFTEVSLKFYVCYFKIPFNVFSFPQAWNRFLTNHLQQYRKTLQKLQSVLGQSGEDSLHTALSLLQTLGELLLVLEENDSMFADQVRSCGKALALTEPTYYCFKSLFLEMVPLQRLETLFKEQEKSTREKVFCFQI